MSKRDFASRVEDEFRKKYPIVLRPHPVIVWLIGTYDWPHIWSLNDLSYDADYNIKNQPNKLQYNIH